MIKPSKIKLYNTIRTRFFRFDFFVLSVDSFACRLPECTQHAKKNFFTTRLFFNPFRPSLGSTWYALCDRKVVLGNREEGRLPRCAEGSGSNERAERVLYDLRDRRSFTAVSSPHLPLGDCFKRLIILHCTSLPRKYRRPARVKNHITFTTILFIAVERFFCVFSFLNLFFLSLVSDAYHDVSAAAVKRSVTLRYTR